MLGQRKPYSPLFPSSPWAVHTHGAGLKFLIPFKAYIFHNLWTGHFNFLPCLLFLNVLCPFFFTVVPALPLEKTPGKKLLHLDKQGQDRAKALCRKKIAEKYGRVVMDRDFDQEESLTRARTEQNIDRNPAKQRPQTLPNASRPIFTTVRPPEWTSGLRTAGKKKLSPG